jgi:hypothetical protein
MVEAREIARTAKIAPLAHRDAALKAAKIDTERQRNFRSGERGNVIATA